MRLSSVRRCAVIVIGTIAFVTGCRGAEGTAGGGTVIIGSGQDPKTLYPPAADNAQATEITQLLFQRLADRGPSLNTLGDSGYIPRLATRWDWSRDSLQITFHIDPRARWQDGQPVSAEDVRFGFAVFTDKKTGSRLGAELRTILDSVTVADSVTAIAWFHQRSPEQFDELVVSMTPLPVHVLRDKWSDSLAVDAFSRDPIGNGAFRLVKWESGVRLEIAPSPTYDGTRPVLDRVIWTFAPDAQTLSKQLMAGESDFLESLSPDDFSAVAKQANLRLVRLGSYSYNFLQFNLYDGASNRPHPLFGERALRRALTMALDRQLLARSAFDTLGRVGLGPNVRAQWAADTTLRQIGFDRAGAARTLDSLGWRAGPDGMRARNGKPLAFTLLVPTSSATRVNYAVLIQEQLRLVGVKVDIEKLDFLAMIDRQKKRAFDAAIAGMNASPTPSGLKQTWTSTAAVEGGFNYGRYESKTFDALVDSAITASAKSAALAHYRAAYQTIVDDAPAIWLYEPPVFAGASARLRLGVVRPDAWWMGLAGWSIAPGGRLPRDAAPTKSP
jgi:peptide/nickel transport system substrate-binding protein